MILFILLLVALVVADQFTKFWIVGKLVVEGQTMPIIDNFFHFTYVRNPGAVFGQAGNVANIYIFFIIAGFVALGIFGFFLYKTNFKDKRLFLFHFSIMMLMAGTIGNMIDRMVQLDHKVIDFIDFRGIWPYVFNIADICLTVGIALFLFDQFILEPKRRKQNEEQSRTII